MISPDAEIRTFLQTLTLGAPVYDRVPEDQVFPYVHISDISNTDMFTADQTIWEVELLLDIVTGFQDIGGGRKDADTIGNALLTALCDTPYTDLGDYLIAKTTMINSIYIDETSDSAYIVRKLMRFNMVIELAIVIPDPNPEPAPPTITSIETVTTNAINATFSKPMVQDATLSVIVLKVDGVEKTIVDKEFPSEDPILAIRTDYEFQFGEVITVEITAGLEAIDGSIFEGGTFMVTNNIADDNPTPVEGVPVITLLSSTAEADRYTGIYGTVAASGYDTAVYLDYGLTTDYLISKQLTGVLAADTDIVSHMIPFLPVATWHWRLRAINSQGTTVTADQTFTISSIEAWRTTSSVGDVDYEHIEGQTHYIDPDALVDGDGSLISPWNNKDTVLDYMANHGGNVDSQYLFIRGTTYAFPNFQYLGSLTNVTFGAYGEGDRPALLSNTANSDTKLFDLCGAVGAAMNNVVISGLNLGHETDESLLTAVVYASNIPDPGGLTIRDCWIHSGQWGVRVISKTLEHKNVRIINTLISDIADDGIYLKHLNGFYVENVDIQRVNLNWFPGANHSDAAGDGIQFINVWNVELWGLRIDRSLTANKFNIIHQMSQTGGADSPRHENAAYYHCQFISHLDCLNIDPLPTDPETGSGAVIYIESLIATAGHPELGQIVDMYNCFIDGNSIDTDTSVTGLFVVRSTVNAYGNKYRNLPRGYENQTAAYITDYSGTFENVDDISEGVVTFE